MQLILLSKPVWMKICREKSRVMNTRENEREIPSDKGV